MLNLVESNKRGVISRKILILILKKARFNGGRIVLTKFSTFEC